MCSDATIGLDPEENGEAGNNAEHRPCGRGLETHSFCFYNNKIPKSNTMRVSKGSYRHYNVDKNVHQLFLKDRARFETSW